MIVSLKRIFVECMCVSSFCKLFKRLIFSTYFQNERHAFREMSILNVNAIMVWKITFFQSIRKLNRGLLL